jgi:hypothetical protein
VAFCSVYRRFAPAFAILERPLNEARKTDSPDLINCTFKVQQAVAELKCKLTSAPVLTLLRVDDDMVLETDV